MSEEEPELSRIGRRALPLAIAVAASALVASACQALLEPRPQRQQTAELHPLAAPSQPHAAAALRGKAPLPELARDAPEAALTAVDAARQQRRRVPIETGIASWYGPGFAGKLTANGEIYDPSGMTAAHPDLPLGSEVVVVNLENGREARLRINDRGPFVGDRVIDVSKAAAKALGFYLTGLAEVRIDRLEPAELTAWAEPARSAEPARLRERRADAGGAVPGVTMTEAGRRPRRSDSARLARWGSGCGVASLCHRLDEPADGSARVERARSDRGADSGWPTAAALRAEAAPSAPVGSWSG